MASQNPSRFEVRLRPLGFYVVDTVTNGDIAPQGTDGINCGVCYAARYVAQAHADRLNGLAAWAEGVVDAR